VMRSRVRFRLDGQVGHLRLVRPEAANAIDLEFAREFEQGVGDCLDAKARAVLLTAEGRHFCAGGDLKAFARQPALGAHLKQVTAHLHAGIERLANGAVPVVAAVQGPAAGAGIGLVCCSDVVLASPSARFVVAYTAVGLTPDGSVSYFLPRLIGMRRAMELTLTNRPVSAQEALELGLVTRLVDEGILGEEAAKLASALSQGPAGALGSAKRLLAASLHNPLHLQLELESETLAANAERSDAREGMRAFLERRSPSFADPAPLTRSTDRLSGNG
jgi:2-(1,2-epoxy-1,2-dihydrophenyl)acetyl-CoA isomerase